MGHNESTADDKGAHRSMRILGVLFVVMGVLVATHKGEFWPFSIYPMFSQAGKPWSRAIVRDYTGVSDDHLWKVTALDEIPGEAFALRDHGIEGPDIANFVVKNRNWSRAGQEGFRKIFLDYLGDRRRLMLFRVNGRQQGDNVVVEAVPVMLMYADTTLLNPDLSLD